MVKSTLTLIAIVFFSQVQGQNWLSFSTPKFPEEIMKASQVEIVNLYEIPADLDQNDSEAGHLVRVVKYPTMSYSFDREGRMEEEIIYKEDSESISSRTEFQYGPAGVLRKDIYTYTYNEVNGTTDTILAQHRIHRYTYDDSGNLVFYKISETDGERELQTDSVHLKYNSDDEIQSIDFRHIQRNIAAITEYTHHSTTRSTGVKKGGGKTDVERDSKGRFIHVVDYLVDSDEPNMDLSFMYKKDRLDSTYAVYKPVQKVKSEPNIISSGYYYDREGKLVMVRTYSKDEMLREQLFEYFPYEIPE